jgi:hypothetical protein
LKQVIAASRMAVQFAQMGLPLRVNYATELFDDLPSRVGLVVEPGKPQGGKNHRVHFRAGLLCFEQLGTDEESTEALV